MVVVWGRLSCIVLLGAVTSDDPSHIRGDRPPTFGGRTLGPTDRWGGKFLTEQRQRDWAWQRDFPHRSWVSVPLTLWSTFLKAPKRVMATRLWKRADGEPEELEGREGRARQKQVDINRMEEGLLHIAGTPDNGPGMKLAMEEERRKKKRCW